MIPGILPGFTCVFFSSLLQLVNNFRRGDAVFKDPFPEFDDAILFLFPVKLFFGFVSLM